MHVGEKREEPQDGDDFELQFLRFVGHPLGQRVQLQIEVAYGQHSEDQENTHHYHPNIRLAGRRDEARQMVGSQRMKLFAQMILHVPKNNAPAGRCRVSAARLNSDQF
jgi:hypothetical protein